MNIRELHDTIKSMIAAGIPEEQAWIQIESTKQVITDTLTPIINDFNDKLDGLESRIDSKIDKIRLEVTIKLGSIMTAGVGVIGIMIFLKN